jgi:hypothetical protein
MVHRSWRRRPRARMRRCLWTPSAARLRSQAPRYDRYLRSTLARRRRQTAITDARRPNRVGRCGFRRTSRTGSATNDLVVVARRCWRRTGSVRSQAVARPGDCGSGRRGGFGNHGKTFAHGRCVKNDDPLRDQSTARRARISASLPRCSGDSTARISSFSTRASIRCSVAALAMAWVCRSTSSS